MNRVAQKPGRVSAALSGASIALYVLWLLIPAVQTTVGAVGGVVAVVLFGVGVLLDVAYWKKEWLSLLGRMVCAAAMPVVLLLFLDRGGTSSLGFVAQQGMFWFPLIFCAYARRRGDARLLSWLKPALLFAVTLTLLTTAFWLVEGMFFRGDKVYAYARSLGSAEPGYEAYLKELMLRNIGGYDFIYAMVAALPLSIIAIRHHRGGGRIAAAGFLALQTVVIILSQYAYAMIYAAVILMAEMVGAALRAIFKRRLSEGLSLLLGLTPLLILWLLRMPLLRLAVSVCQSAGLENFAFNFEQLLLALQGSATSESARLVHYQKALEGIARSPLTGSMFGGTKMLSLHSDVLDLLSGMGVLGAAAVCGMIWLMGRGSLQGAKQSPYRAQLCEMWLAVAITAVLGTVCYSRDIMAIVALGTLLVLEGTPSVCNRSKAGKIHLCDEKGETTPMDHIRLIEPTEEYTDQIWEYRARFQESQEDSGGCGSLLDCESVEEWLAETRALSRPETCPEGRVPADLYLAVRTSDNRLVGMIDLRHHIDHPILGTWGGHIGYSVHPDERRKGYATRMLALNLENARKLGLERVMVTCDDDNLASEKTIVKNGGVYEKDVPVDGCMVKRFWIEL